MYTPPTGFDSITESDIDRWRTPRATPHATQGHSLRELYPEHACHASLDALIASAAKYNDSDATEAAATAAIADPHSRVNPATIANHLRRATTGGLLPLVTELSNRLRPRSAQPVVPARDIPPRAPHSLHSSPPYPTDAALDGLCHAHDGFHVAFDPPTAGPKKYRPRSVGAHRAMEATAAAEMAKGLGIVLPAAAVRALCASERMPCWVTDSFIRGKPGVPAGRRVDDYTSSGVNTDAKHDAFAAINGSYGDPDMPYFCRRLQAAIAAHGRDGIVIAIADIDAYYRRMRVHPTSVTTLCTWFQIDGADHYFLPFGGPFGLMESNSTALAYSEALHAIVSDEDVRVCGRVIGGVYVDDMGAFAHLSEVLHFFQTRYSATHKLVGDGAISTKKNRWGQREVLLGYLWDTVTMTVGISPSLLLKYIWALHHLLPAAVERGTTIRTRTAERVAAYMILVSGIAQPLRAFSKGLFGCMKGARSHAKSSLHLNTDAVIDIEEHRRWIQRLWTDARPAFTGIDVPPILYKEVGESRQELQLRQLGCAHTVLFTDASGTDQRTGRWGGGWAACPAGTTIATQGDAVIDYGSDVYVALATTSAIGDALHINIQEMLVTLRAIDAHVTAGHRPAHLAPGQPWHIHTLTDNTPSLYNLLKCKGVHPLIPFLLREHSKLAEKHSLLLTYGEIKGSDNWLSDALSRQCKTAAGTRALTATQGLQRNPTWAPWWANMEASCRR